MAGTLRQFDPHSVVAKSPFSNGVCCHNLALGQPAEVLGRPIKCDVHDPAELEALCKAGFLSAEHWYAKGAVDSCVHVADGRTGYLWTVHDEAAYILGRPAATFKQGAEENRT